MGTFSLFLKRTKHWLALSLHGTHGPNAIIVGAQKAGTTSLYRYLTSLPHISGASRKELHFFDKPYRFQQGKQWYEKHFIPRGFDGERFIESSPSYLARRDVPNRIKSMYPEMKIIILLREPVSRAYSAWNMYREMAESGNVPRFMRSDLENGIENPLYDTFFRDRVPSFPDYIDQEMALIERNEQEEEPSVIRRGIYEPQIKRYIDTFGKRNILIIGFRELSLRPWETTQKAASFIDPSLPVLSMPSELEVTSHNQRSYESSMDTASKQRLSAFYEPYNQRLFRILGGCPDW